MAEIFHVIVFRIAALTAEIAENPFGFSLEEFIVPLKPPGSLGIGRRMPLCFGPLGLDFWLFGPSWLLPQKFLDALLLSSVCHCLTYIC